MADFSQNVVNQRFREVFRALENANLIRGKSDIAKKLDTYNHVVNAILKGQRNITVDQLHKLFDIYKVNANYLFGISEEMFQDKMEIPSMPMSERSTIGKSNITLVPQRAMAGYALEHQEGDFLNEFPKFSVPNLSGDLVAFEISGDSMMPTITSGDIVVCEPIEANDPIRDNHVYVVVTDVVVAKRIQPLKNANNETVQLSLISDNGGVYKPFTVDVSEVRQILKVKCRLTNYAIS